MKMRLLESSVSNPLAKWQKEVILGGNLGTKGGEFNRNADAVKFLSVSVGAAGVEKRRERLQYIRIARKGHIARGLS